MQRVTAPLETAHSILSGKMRASISKKVDSLLNVHLKQRGVGSESSLWQFDSH
jgi:hypothetical protein